MRRSRFRSQPMLERSGGQPRLPMFGAGLAMIVGIGVLAVQLVPPPAPPAPLYTGDVPQTPAGGLTAVASNELRPEALLATPAARVPMATIAAHPKARPSSSYVHLARASSRKALRSSSRAALAKAASVHDAEPRLTLVRAYERALERYDRGERAEGYRWASEN